MPGELLKDDPVVSPDAAFEVKVHNAILDTVVGSINRKLGSPFWSGQMDSPTQHSKNLANV